MQRAAGDRAINWERDTSPFAKELLLARDAGFLTWNDQSGRDVGATDPLNNAHYWMQQIWELRLTLKGRDRAQGSVILRPLPDPDEDDDRPITGMTLEEIAGQIPLKTRAGQGFRSIPGVVVEEAVQWQYPYGSTGALLSPERTQEFDASFMYAAAQGTVMVMSRCPAEQYVPAQLVVA